MIIIMLFLWTDSPQKLKLEKIHDTLIIFFYVSLSSPHHKVFSFFTKTPQKTTSLQQVTGGNTPNLVLKIFSKFSNSTTQENTTILRLKVDCETYRKKKPSNQKLNQ